MACTYSFDEVFAFLDLVIITGSVEEINRKSTNIAAFNSLAKRLYRRNYRQTWQVKSGTQWRTKWKALKSKYLSLKKDHDGLAGEWLLARNYLIRICDQSLSQWTSMHGATKGWATH